MEQLSKRHTYKIKDWSIRENSVPEEECFRNKLLFDKDKILLPLLYIKLELLKNFIKTMIKYGQDFEYLREQLPTYSNVRLNEVFFIWWKFVKSLIYLNIC
jgi:hypothetical protein